MRRLLFPTTVAFFLGGTLSVSAASGPDDTHVRVELRAAVGGELLDGFVNSNPCAELAPFTEYSFWSTGNVRSDSVEYTFVQAPLGSGELDAQWFATGPASDYYAVIDVATFSTVTVTEAQYNVACRDPHTNRVDDATRSLVWVPLVTEQTLIPDVMAELVELVPAPDVFFPLADPAYGWLYVKTPMEVRVANLEPVTATVTAANAVSSATATATAEPRLVLFEPGEPGGQVATCSVEAVQAGWDRNDPDGSGCVYAYVNSSAITASRQFQPRTRVQWHVTGSGGLDMVIETAAFDHVAVAEVQAVVVAP